MRGIIAEIGNSHFGDMEKAKALIKAAKDSGAHYVKMQAIDTMEFQGGSMPREFYRQCDLGINGYMDCVDYSRQVGIPIFFSIFGSKYLDLMQHYPDMPYKISGQQFLTFTNDGLNHWNTQEDHPVIVSIPKCDSEILNRKKTEMSMMHLMYVSEYLQRSVDFGFIGDLIEVFRRPIGYSDHTIGIDACKRAVVNYGCQLVEKHFNIFGEQSFDEIVYRDSIHAADSKQMSELAKIYRERFNEVPDMPRI